MKCLLTILLGMLVGLPLSAQTEEGKVAFVDSIAPADVMLEEPIGSESRLALWRPSYYGLPAMAGYSPTYLPVYHSRYLGMHSMDLWNVHDGLNASVDMGVSVGLGKNNPWRGAHFFTDLSLMYAHPVNDRLTLAAGLNYGYFSGLGSGANSLSLFGLANYKINDRFDVTGFVSHDFGQLSNNERPGQMPIMPFTGPSTTVGADVGIKVGENAKINIGVSFTREENTIGPPPPVRPESQRERFLQNNSHR